MGHPINQLIADELKISVRQTSNTRLLLEGGATVPFISRYRKEHTGDLDETQVLAIKERLEYYTVLEKRKETVLHTIEEQGKLTEELRRSIEGCFDQNKLEDIYLPYKPKRKTRASVAKENGLAPLADWLLLQTNDSPDQKARAFINENVPDVGAAIHGACDIIAEKISEDAVARERIRKLFAREAIISSKSLKSKEAEGIKYKDYFDYSGPLKKTPSHRLLAIRRGEKEGFLSMDISVEMDDAINILERTFIKRNNESADIVRKAITDGYKRLLKPSIETEFRLLSKTKADDEAIKVFSTNLRQLLLSAPLGPSRVLAIDPGYRTGCKLAALDEQGGLIFNETIYPHQPQGRLREAEGTVRSLVDKYKITAIGIGNGTASKETEKFIRNIKFDSEVNIFVVSESGASVYSASEVAREEFPDQDITVRGAVSIGRRLIDPLSELVKIDPRSIGVGQYQHDVDQKRLQEGLDNVVVSCVNQVGVDLNTAGKYLLNYVSGLGPKLAQNIVEYRAKKGPFKTREELLKVPLLGNKAFEQAAGFLRIPNAVNPLDSSAVHPESYHIVETMASQLGCSLNELVGRSGLKTKENLKKFISEDIGEFTIKDILDELEKPGRDPREELEQFSFAEGMDSISDLREGQKIPGIITNITNFGAFVDVGVKQDGLVHISHLANKFVSDPNEVVKLGQKVMVKVLEVDVARKRIALSIKEN